MGPYVGNYAGLNLNEKGGGWTFFAKHSLRICLAKLGEKLTES